MMRCVVVVSMVAAVMAGTGLAGVCPSQREPVRTIAGIPASVRLVPRAVSPPSAEDCVAAWNTGASSGERRALAGLRPLYAVIGDGSIGARGVSGPSCVIDFALSRTQLARLKVNGPATLNLSTVWNGAPRPSWFGGVDCGPPPQLPGSSIIGGKPLRRASVTASGLLHLG